MERMDCKKSESVIVGIVLVFAIFGLLSNMGSADLVGMASGREESEVLPQIILSKSSGYAGSNVKMLIVGLPNRAKRLLKKEGQISVMFDGMLVKTFAYGGESPFSASLDIPYLPRGEYEVSLEEFPEINSEFWIDGFGCRWTKTYGTREGDAAFDIIKDENTYVLSGQKDGSIDGGDAWLIKLDEYGETIWEENYGGSSWEQAESVIETSEGYLFVGETWSYGSGQSDFYIVNVGEEGEVIWESNYGGSGRDELHDVIEVDGGYLATGYSGSYSGDFDMILLKIDEKGNKEWVTNYGGPNTQMAYNLVKGEDGYIVVGRDFQTKKGIIMKVNEKGDIIWSKEYQKDEDESYSYNIIDTGDGYIVVGTHTARSDSLWIFKINENGEVIWEKSHYADTSPVDYHYDIIKSDNGYLISYPSWEGNGKTDFVLFEIDNEGNKEWKKIYGGSDYDSPSGLIKSDKGYMVAGSTMSYGQGDADLWLINFYGKMYEEFP